MIYESLKIGDLATIVVLKRCVHALVYRIYLEEIVVLIIDNETCAELAIPAGSWLVRRKGELVRWKSLNTPPEIMLHNSGMIRVNL